MLDQKKGLELDCGTCSVQLQTLRNCSGSGRPAMIDLNGKVYQQCPRMLYWQHTGEREMVNYYFRFDQTKQYPLGGAPGEQTYFLVEVFDFIAEYLHTHRTKQANQNTPKK